ncbi:CRISPR-associated protein Cas4 [Clostridium botulinum]|uniref:CRISPR-associated protein Cas4 n=1 Tax=Clostridium botulinum TaxID=1491 RepID=UPI00057EA8C0|nr:CRISPR-associated protein Cas4 [Clostridium botulinum]MCD3276690.1 CRISPR-associated protein Cas4 [Clostridium botulinum C/D]MCD3288285.1 CRISPR-associated protein Cas4 [Clostridium botulinum C/D]MCD3290798.1 CRISPR-associated protein Cas4 [Clostridium botulinum C/D]MCD3303782.1 CRISPR-associated protein Cas4 [Clostridium botulinum C/D]NFO98791.1 CRISPR-associated protein Cas4 [Clostridium botulinum]
MDFNLEKFKTQGIKVNYYYVCKRKLWLFSKGIALESSNDRVMSGKIIHENSYNRKKNKEVLIDNLLRLDIMDKDYVREVKITSKMPLPDRMQLLYYLFYLKNMGINKKGSINYVKEKQTEEIELTDSMEEKIKNTLIDINNIINLNKPPKLKKLPYCTKCAYYQFCYVEEEE